LLYLNTSFDVLFFSYLYLFLYNFSLLSLFWILNQQINTNLKTIYSFADLKLNFFFSTSASVALFSIAGVPPFVGFFSKLLVVVLLINNTFFFLFFFFGILIFFALYFYLQNIRFLHTSNNTTVTYSFQNNLRLSSLFFFIMLFFLFFLFFGFLFFDELLLTFTWLFI
jgi:NADH:ubiquinone oxidoreductase subunit 2 (subunit N)